MDLASLASISACVERLKKSVEKVDILVNNAGVMMCPLSKTEDGFEMQIGTNHFGHFYLTNLLLPMIKKVVLLHIASCIEITQSIVGISLIISLNFHTGNEF